MPAPYARSRYPRPALMTETPAARIDAPFAEAKAVAAGDLIRTAVRGSRPEDAGRRALPSSSPSARGRGQA